MLLLLLVKKWGMDLSFRVVTNNYYWVHAFYSLPNPKPWITFRFDSLEYNLSTYLNQISFGKVYSLQVK